jgi:putative ABC transport system substrate-binding protein
MLFLLSFFSALLFSLCFPVWAQQPKKIFRVGFLSPIGAQMTIKVFREGMRDLGYVEGKDILIEYRNAQGKYDRLSDLAAELVRLKVDVIVTSGGTPTALAAQRTTQTVPIVFVSVGDPVASGLVASLARPGGNLTGLTNFAPELSGKRLELFKEAFPNISRVAIIQNPANPAAPLLLKETQVVAQALGLQLQAIGVRTLKDLEKAFEVATTRGANALFVPPDPLISAHRQRIVELAAKSRLPAMYDNREIAESGGLMSYGPDRVAMFRRAAIYVDKILKGAKPADLPVEQPMKFEFVINLKTAKQIGLTIPPNVLARADKVIR